ncbi:hypothetical protein KQI41_18650 [Tissierella pigra]|uniref:hypothetical protein n=1 Tax=Tissierella pigra TaxID=2607614 RepID=UPI001C108025|nr:hypothetical protein [Tissierella pigra]MBU5428413.1 hypothetical protein [Tissierella pigra]
MSVKTIKIHWSYPIIYQNIFYSDGIYGKGIYYISRKFGNNETLLYIGKTSSSFYNRLSCHKYWIDQYRGKVFIRLGEIISPKCCNDGIITDVESTLIYEMKPIENTDKINGYYYSNLCKIINTGYKGILPTIITMEDH